MGCEGLFNALGKKSVSFREPVAGEGKSYEYVKLVLVYLMQLCIMLYIL